MTGHCAHIANILWPLVDAMARIPVLLVLEEALMTGLVCGYCSRFVHCAEQVEQTVMRTRTALTSGEGVSYWQAEWTSRWKLARLEKLVGLCLRNWLECVSEGLVHIYVEACQAHHMQAPVLSQL